jgi:hypothetical protein
MNYPTSLNIMSIADNKGLVTTLAKRSEYTAPYPNTTLQPDWDLIEEIYSTYQSLSIASVRFTWIKGHQDKDAAYDELPVAAQYNIDADHLAEEYIDAHPHERPLSPLVPAARCLFQLRNETIHGHYNNKIREAASIPDLHRYLRRKHNWNNQTTRNIQWEWFRLAANNYSHTDNHLTKLVYEQLPTQAHKSKQGGHTWLSPNCRHCNQALETFDHLLRCDHPSSKKFRSDLPLKVLSYCKKKNTPHNFHVTIVVTLEQWVRDQPPLESIQASSAVHKLIHSQKQIGWTRFLRGFLSKQWHDYLEYEFNHNIEAPAPAHFDYDQFFSGLIKIMWEQQTNFWMDFLKSIQQNERSAQIPSRVDEYKMEIRHLYSLRGQVLPQHRDEYFPNRLSEFLDYSTPSQLRTYITNYKPAIRQSIKEAHKRATNSKRIYQFPGFHRNHCRPIRPTLENPLEPNSSDIPQQPTNIHIAPITRTNHRINPLLKQMTSLGTNAHNVTRNERERPHHKHTRWKPLQAVRDKFQSFFTTITTPNTNNKQQHK